MTQDPAAIAGKLSVAAYDKTGRKIEVGDVLKVFHFQGPRRKRFYMFKQVVGERTLGASCIMYLIVSHLNLKDAQGPDGGYYIAQDGHVEAGTEIVQGIYWHHDRVRQILEEQDRGE